MKVLFAVQDEQISTKIVKEYQRKYKEIISYKNIYYFNAIIKELQKDKTYDRIIIDEDLEEISSTNDQKDKFIFDKLDKISDEAINVRGQDIPIILICSERRNKLEDIFVRLFGLGIYNAIIGDDRSTEEVCKLIERPRLKKQAKMYYKIDSDEVQYKHEDENDVSEEEMQNIIMHFKKIGKNEDQYAESFSKIIKQYNKEQIKIIIKILPMNVKQVLQETSLEYQELVSNNDKMKRGLENKQPEKGTVEKLLGVADNKSRMSKPVVVPTTMQQGTVKKLAVKTPVTKYDIDEYEFDEEYEEDVEEVIEPEIIEEAASVTESLEQQPRRRGRPRKNQESNVKSSNEPSIPRKRGRPKKVTNNQDVLDVNDETTFASNMDETDFSKSLGIEEEEYTTELPGFNDDAEEDITELPGFNDDTEEDITELPGFNDDAEEDVTELPGFNDDAEEDVTELPGFNDDAEEDVTELPGFNDDAEEDITELPGFNDDAEEDVTELPGFNDDVEEDITELPGFNDDAEEDVAELPGFDSNNDSVMSDFSNFSDNYAVEDSNINNSMNRMNSISSTEYEYDKGSFENLLSADKKVVIFVGTSKNGTSFAVNNVAQYLSMNGINTAILDTTRNKNSYYIYTKNEEELRKKAMNSIPNLLGGSAEGISVNQNLSVYTSVPNQDEGIENVDRVLDTLVRNHSVVLIDSDFNSPLEYFDRAQEIYLVQSMDVLTIQPLTAFLRELKSKNILEQSKIRIILNKAIKLRGISAKNIIGGMAFYNDPEMSFMTELFDRNTVRYIEIPFDEEVYAIYLEGIIECEISVNNYPKNFAPILKELANMVYPLLPSANNNVMEKRKRGYDYSSGFSSSVNNTLNNMKKRY